MYSEVSYKLLSCLVVDLVIRGRQLLLEYISSYLGQQMNHTAEICVEK